MAKILDTKGLTYNNIVVIPKLGIVNTRDDVDVSQEFLGKQYKLPIIPANMKCVIDFKLAEWLANNGYFYILHRFYSYDDVFNWIKDNQNLPLISISIGVKQRDVDFIDKIFHAGLRVDVVTIDISHGYSILMKKMITEVKSQLNCKVIAGNIWGDKDSVESLQSWGADALKVGLSYGKACFLGNTLINSENGFIKIKDIKIGDLVKTHTGELKPVIDKIKKQSDDLLEVNGEICTKNHKFYVINKTNTEITDDYVEKNAYWLEANKIDENNHFIIMLDH